MDGTRLGQDSGNVVAWFLDRHVAQGRGPHPAFIDPQRTLTYAQLAEASARFAGGLAAAGIGRERRLLMLMQDTVDFPIAFWGAIRAGVVPVPVIPLRIIPLPVNPPPGSAPVAPKAPPKSNIR